MCCLCKAQCIRRISAVSNSIQRIKFGRNSTSESAAAFLPHVRLVLSHYPAKMRHRFERRLSAASNLIHALCVLSMSKFGSAIEKEETWPYLSQCNLNILQHILLHCQPSPPRCTAGQFLAKFKSFVAQYVPPPYWVLCVYNNFCWPTYPTVSILN